jgi:succinyl-CoA synthetase beta subunit
MHLYEYEGKALFKKFKIPTPQSVLITNPQQATTSIARLKSNEVMLKAQVLRGKRGKSGLIQKTIKETAKTAASKLFKHKDVSKILIEKIISIQHEYYLSITINPTSASYTLLFSDAGGIDIEDVPKNKIKKHNFITFKKTQINKITKNKDITNIAEKMFQAMKASDATLVEINPLVQISSTHFVRKKFVNKSFTSTTSRKDLYMALDAKVTIDTNALYRQPSYRPLYGREHTKLESQAQTHQIHYVELSGNIAVIGNGAGLVMSTLDTLKHHNLKPANFCDAPGGTEKKAMIESLKIALSKHGVKALFINMFGGITKTDDVAEAIVAFKKKYKPKIPIVIRMFGTNYKKAHTILKRNNIQTFKTVQPCIKELKRIVK